MDNELELEGLVFEVKDGQNALPEDEALEDQENLSDRWAFWNNIVNR